MTSIIASKKMKLEEEMSSLKAENKHIDDLPSENLGQILRSGLSVIDRLHCSRVSRHWKWAVGEFAWTEQRKIDRDTVFEGIPPENLDRYSERFWQIATPRDDCHLVSLLNLIALSQYNNNLVELDLHSFGNFNVQQFVPRIAESIQLFQKLEKLNIQDFDLGNFVEFLPSSLRTLDISAGAVIRISLQTLEKLSLKCPKLEEVPFYAVENITLDIVNNYLPRFPGQTTLDLEEEIFQNGNLAAITELKQLKVLHLHNYRVFDAESFEAMVSSCQNLRSLDFWNANPLEEAFIHLAKLPNLVVLEVGDREATFTASVLRKIAKRGVLKRLLVQCSELTDDSIMYLIDQCKSLVSLVLFECPQITERSVEAVVAEVKRRHGNPPRTLPTGPEDPALFYFQCDDTGINQGKALEMTAGNPWIDIFFDDSIYDPRNFF